MNKKLILSFLAISLLFGQQTNNTKKPKEKLINLKFRDLNLKTFIRLVARITHKNILLPGDIYGKVNFISVKPVTKDEVYNILLTVLRNKGYTITEDENGILKVIRTNVAIKTTPPKLIDANKINPNIQSIATTIIGLHNINAVDAFSYVNYLLSPIGRININKKDNLLIITDYPANIVSIKKMLEKLEEVKKNEDKKIGLYKFKNIDITEVKDNIKKTVEDLYDPKTYKYSLIFDDKHNRVLVIARKNIIDNIMAIIKNYDEAPTNNVIITKIVRIKNSDVNNIAKILQNIVQKETSLKNKKIKTNPGISITADAETNSLILVGKVEKIKNLERIIKELDIPKEQVYVKVRILEISNSKLAQIGTKLGIEGGFFNSSSGIFTFAGNLGGDTLAFNPANYGLSLPLIKKGILLGATFDLLETLGAAKKISEPSILCVNNKQSSIYVGKTITVLTGKTTSTSTSESYSRQDIGITLKVKPRIDSDNKVALNVKTVIEDILPGSPTLTPITSKREVNTDAIVKNGESIIIGGLIKNNNDITTKKVPLLGDIPIIGNLFKHKDKNKDQTSLVIVLTPYIVKKPEQLEGLRNVLNKLKILENKFKNKLLQQIKGIPDNNDNKNENSNNLYLPTETFLK